LRYKKINANIIAMASIIPGYEYDIFISYRHNDNRAGWVTEFVVALQEELVTTLKEPVSVYFDTNPNDGLLESHNVDKSLQGKLKCLIFIPIISQTYCDINSFAWQKELCAFNKLAKEDQFGRDIRLGSGNVASRVLPVRIHDLDSEDKALIENELGGLLRSIEFIFRAAGVNRPLRANEDHPQENLNKTYYRDQINKVANGVKELFNAIKRYNLHDVTDLNEVVKAKPVKPEFLKPRSIIGFLIVLSMLVLGYFFIPEIFKPAGPADKSIAVLPFENMSNEIEQEYFSDAMMQEILNHLFMIGGLKIPSSTSSMRFKGSTLPVREIARELGVSYILEGNVYRSGDEVRIIVRLINGKNEVLLWTQDYKRALTATNLLEIQSDVAQQVADNMRVVINPEVKRRIEVKPTLNTEAYILYLQAWNQYLTFDQAEPKLEKAIFLDPEFGDAYALLAYYWLHRGAVDGNIEREKVLEKTNPLVAKSLELNKNSIVAHTVLASLSLYYFWDFESVDKEYQIIKQLNPSNSDLQSTGFFSDYLLASGKYHEAFTLTKDAFDLSDNSRDNQTQMALTYYYTDQPEKALETIETARKLYPDDFYILTMAIRLYNYEGKFKNTATAFEKSTIDKNPDDLIPLYLGHLGIAYFKTGNNIKGEVFLNELLNRSKKSPVGSPSFFAAAVYTAMGENDKALKFLEKGYSDHEVEMYWIKVEPLFRPLHGDSRFGDLLVKMGFK